MDFGLIILRIWSDNDVGLVYRGPLASDDSRGCKNMTQSVFVICGVSFFHFPWPQLFFQFRMT